MDERIQEIKFSISNEATASSSDVTIRFVFNEDGNIIRIEGTGPQHEYEGQLTLRGKGLTKAGGDHCLVCRIGEPCVVEVPCKSCS